MHYPNLVSKFEAMSDRVEIKPQHAWELGGGAMFGAAYTSLSNEERHLLTGGKIQSLLLSFTTYIPLVLGFTTCIIHTPLVPSFSYTFRAEFYYIHTLVMLGVCVCSKT